MIRPLSRVLLNVFPQASLWILRVAVGTVSNVDLPLDEVLGAMVQATGPELLEGMGTKPPSAVNDGPGPVPSAGATDGRRQVLQGEAYKFLCEFMQEVEPSQLPPPRLFGCLPCLHSSTPITPPTASVNWKDSMVQVRNARGGWAWVLKENMEAYLGSPLDAPSTSRPPFS